MIPDILRAPCRLLCAAAIISALGLPGLLAGAGNRSTPDADRTAKLSRHVIRANEDGLAVAPNLKGKASVLAKAAFEAQVTNIFLTAESWARTNSPAPETTGSRVKVPILVFVHGGLNTWQDTVNRVAPKNGEESLADCMLNDPRPSDRHYPVFISWPAGAMKSYGEHLFQLRQGLRERKGLKRFTAWTTAPVWLATDLAKAAVNIPVNLAHQSVNTRDRFAFHLNDTEDDRRPKLLGDLFLLSEANALRALAAHPESVARGNRVPSDRGARWMHNLKAAAPAPFRWTIGTLVQGDFSSASWRIMKRRTRNIYIPAQVFEWIHGEPGANRISNNVPAGHFLDMLIQHAANRTVAKDFEYEITLVGHSMGTIVLNNFLNAYRSKVQSSGALHRIIYMAAACSVRDGLGALRPILESCGRPNGCKTGLLFYNLTLHPIAEISEGMFYNIIPAGTLLHQIDNHLDTPNTALDRTLGSDANAMAAIDEFQLPSLSRHFRFVCYDYELGTLPMHHGDFSHVPFWRQSFLDRQGLTDRTNANVMTVQTLQPNATRANVDPNWLKAGR